MKQIDLTTLVNPPNTDSISGRDFGIEYAKKIGLLEILDRGEKVEFVINDEFVKAINDSFIKGLFNDVFKKYRTLNAVKEKVTINSNDYFKRLFNKNWVILQEIHNV